MNKSLNQRKSSNAAGRPRVKDLISRFGGGQVRGKQIKGKQKVSKTVKRVLNKPQNRGKTPLQFKATHLQHYKKTTGKTKINISKQQKDNINNANKTIGDTTTTLIKASKEPVNNISSDKKPRLTVEKNSITVNPKLKEPEKELDEEIDGIITFIDTQQKKLQEFLPKVEESTKSPDLKGTISGKKLQNAIKNSYKTLNGAEQFIYSQKSASQHNTSKYKKIPFGKKVRNLATFFKKLLTRKSADVLNTPKSANAKNTKAQQKLLKNDRKHIKKLQIKAAEAWNKFQETHTKMDFMIVTSLSSQLVKALDDYSVRSRKKLSDKKRMLKEYTNSNLKNLEEERYFRPPSSRPDLKETFSQWIFGYINSGIIEPTLRKMENFLDIVRGLRPHNTPTLKKLAPSEMRLVGYVSKGYGSWNYEAIEEQKANLERQLDSAFANSDNDKKIISVSIPLITANIILRGLYSKGSTDHETLSADIKNLQTRVSYMDPDVDILEAIESSRKEFERPPYGNPDIAFVRDSLSKDRLDLFDSKINKAKKIQQNFSENFHKGKVPSIEYLATGYALTAMIVLNRKRTPTNKAKILKKELNAIKEKAIALGTPLTHNYIEKGIDHAFRKLHLPS